ncbi:hypothetical protein G6N74_26745 [Mesorhizobium sp. CGMCC 1.15528]|uniref:Antibiotic biosynthesis monooxygenase n=1 Tax=Mesorhizobium zhangyense TaxID=1776730 RepID=A0A7C9RB14_9HYPH|nr:hypothetical protein [Mesorhizobium zhangyense]NGN44661.1 hypothetical protein [Mesorhizobium zhangyense]
MSKNPATPGSVLGIVVKLIPKPGQCEACVVALRRLFDESAKLPSFVEAAVYAGDDGESILMVERWAETPASFQKLLSSAKHFALFEHETDGLIETRDITFFNGQALWQ